MLNFDETRYLRIQSGAVAMAKRYDCVIGACIEAGAENIFLSGTGAAILMQLAAPASTAISHLHRYACRIDP